MTPTLNIPYWTHQYEAYVGDDSIYWNALDEPCLVERIKKLWAWKSLNRTIDFDDTAKQVIEDIDFQKYLADEREQAIIKLRTRLRGEVLSEGNTSLVTPAFLLHLADSDPGAPSARYPIYDVMTWNAYVFLWTKRDDDEVLYTTASTSPEKYGEFCADFEESLPANTDPRTYEKALFMLGRHIVSLQRNNDECNTIADISDALMALEASTANNEPLAERS